VKSKKTKKQTPLTLIERKKKKKNFVSVKFWGFVALNASVAYLAKPNFAQQNTRLRKLLPHFQGFRNSEGLLVL